MQSKALIFDFDGVLVVTPKSIIKQFQETESHLGYEPHSLEEHIGQWGKSWNDFWSNWYSEEEIETISNYFFESLDKEHIPAPKVDSTLGKLQNMGYFLGVISNHEKDYLEESFTGAGINQDRFDIILGAGEKKVEKPNWRVFSALPDSFEKIIYIGDTDIDYKTVKNARESNEFSPEIYFIGISQAKDEKMRNLFTENLKEAGVPEDKIISSFSKLPEILKKEAW